MKSIFTIFPYIVSCSHLGFPFGWFLLSLIQVDVGNWKRTQNAAQICRSSLDNLENHRRLGSRRLRLLASSVNSSHFKSQRNAARKTSFPLFSTTAPCPTTI